MELTNEEITVLVDYYGYEIENCRHRLDHIHNSIGFDPDLKEQQIDRVKNELESYKSRVEELKKLRK